MSTFIRHRVGGLLLLAAVVLVPSAAQAQGYYGHYGNYGNYGNTSQTNWHIQQGIHTERPGAAIVGGLLQGIGGGLAAQNASEHAVAIGVLQGLGQGFNIASQPSIYSQGTIQQSNQGYYNNGGYVNWGQRPAGRPNTSRPHHGRGWR